MKENQTIIRFEDNEDMPILVCDDGIIEEIVVNMHGERYGYWRYNQVYAESNCDVWVLLE